MKIIRFALRVLLCICVVPYLMVLGIIALVAEGMFDYLADGYLRAERWLL